MEESESDEDSPPHPVIHALDKEINVETMRGHFHAMNEDDPVYELTVIGGPDSRPRQHREITAEVRD